MEFLIFLVVFAVLLIAWAAIGHVLWIAIHACLLAVGGKQCARCGTRHLAEHQCASKNLSLLGELEALDCLISRCGHSDLLNQERLTLLRNIKSEIQAAAMPEQARQASRPAMRLESTYLSTSTAPPTQLVDAAPIVAHLVEQEPSTNSFTHTELDPRNEDHATQPPIILTPTAAQPEERLHPLDQPDDVESTQTPAAPPRDTLGPNHTDATTQERQPAENRLEEPTIWTADVLQRFMQQSNIRWIELISASLVVICSVGLVVSLWSTLSQASRVFPTLVFLMATLAVHGAGQYTLRQWNLRSTSRGILHIALMLIPLAVLVGILMATRRDGVQETVDQIPISSLLAIGGGMIVYVALAVTACRALFLHRWRRIATTVVSASLGLVAIGLESSSQGFSSWLQWSPIGVTSVCGIAYSMSSVKRLSSTSRWTEKKSRELAGSVIQILFATSVLLVFAYTQMGELHRTRQVWWLAAGSIGLVWGTVASGLSLNLGTVAKARVPSWLRVGTWILFLASAGLMLLSIRYVPTSQIEFASVMAAVGIWLAAYGVYSARAMLAQLGVLAIELSFVLVVAAFSGQSEMMTRFAPWLAWQNVALLSACGLATMAILLIPDHLLQKIALRRKPSFFPQHAVDLPRLTKQFSLAGIGPFALSCGLTFIASFQGATWASHVLLAEGCMSILAGFAICSDRIRNLTHLSIGKFSTAAVATGQALMLIGAIELAVTDTWLQEILSRVLAGRAPQLAWTAAVIPIAVAWAILGVVARCFAIQFSIAETYVKTSILSLAWSAVLAILPCVMSYTVTFGATPLALAVGALLPIITLLNLLSCREAIWRESLVLSFVSWSTWGGFISLASYGSFPALGFACSCSTIALCGLAGLVAMEAALAVWRRVAAIDAPLWNVIYSTESRDKVVPTIAVGVGWLATLLPLLVTFVHVLSRTWEAPLAIRHAEFYGESFSLGRSSIVFLALASFGIVSATAAKWNWAAAPQLLTLCGPLPLGCCVLLACSVPTEHSIVALLWASACGTVALEVLYSRKGRQLALPNVARRGIAWFDLAQATMIATLVLFTIAAFVDAERAANARDWTFVFLNIAPAAITFCIGWLVAMRQGVDQARIAGCGGSLVCCILMASFHAIDGTAIERILHSATIGGLALSVLSLSSLAAFSRAIDTRAASTSFGQCALAIFISRSGLALVCILLAIAGQGEQLAQFHTGVLGGLLPVAGLALAGACIFFVKPATQSEESALRTLSIDAAVKLFVAASPLLVVVLSANILNIDFSSQIGTLAPMHSLVLLWIGILSIDLSRELARFVSGSLSPNMQLAQWSGLAAATSAMSFAMVFNGQSFLPTVELMALALLVLISGKILSCWLRPYFASALACGALLPFFGVGIASLGPWTESSWYAYCGLMWGPLAVIAISLTLDRIYAGFSDASKKIPAGAFTLERYSLIQIPLVLLPVSFVWQYSVLSIDGSLSRGAIVCLAVSLTALAISIARIWNAEAKQKFWPAYLNTLALSALVAVAICSLVDLPAPLMMIWVVTLLCLMALVAQMVRELIIRGGQWARPLGLEGVLNNRPRLERIAYWLTTIHLTAGLLAILPALIWVLGQDLRPVRVAAALVPLLVVASVVPMVTTRANALVRYLTLCMLTTTVELCWWTFIPPLASYHNGGAFWAYGQHTFAALIATAMVFYMAGCWLHSHKERASSREWAGPLYSANWGALVAGVSLGGVLMLGVQPNLATAQFETFTKLLSVFAWAAISARLLQLATRPAMQDAWASLVQRKTAVYAAQVCLAFMCVRLHACFPELFAGLILPWWPIFVLALSMAAAFASTLLHRCGIVVLADPLDNLALLLPLSPIIGLGLWTDPSGIWDSWIAYSLVLIAAAGIYTAQSRDHRRGKELTIGLRTIAVVFLLASYWSFLLSSPSWRMTEHPQFWLLPPALATLAYAQWSKSMLTKEALAATRYVSLLVAYLSSSTEAFMSAFSGGLWQPAVLIVLALAGIAAGIVAQVRSFVYCGAVFTFVALLAMVLQAQQAIGQVWPWWVFGIATGASLIVALGYMEKNRGRVHQYIARVRGWNA